MFFLLLLNACAGMERKEEKSSLAIWEKMKKVLPGSWSAPTERGTIKVSYKLISGGSALLEDFVTSNGKETVTVYHPDGLSLLLTHYCAQGNQARLRAR
jgi:hypothetical protein